MGLHNYSSVNISFYTIDHILYWSAASLHVHFLSGIPAVLSAISVVEFEAVFGVQRFRSVVIKEFVAQAAYVSYKF